MTHVREVNDVYQLKHAIYLSGYAYVFSDSTMLQCAINEFLREYFKNCSITHAKHMKILKLFKTKNTYND